MACQMATTGEVKAQLALLLPDELWSTDKSWGRARVVFSYLVTDGTTKLEWMVTNP